MQVSDESVGETASDHNEDGKNVLMSQSIKRRIDNRAAIAASEGK